MEGHPRHAEIIIKPVGLEDCARVLTPNEKVVPKKLTDDDVKELGKEDASP